MQVCTWVHVWVCVCRVCLGISSPVSQSFSFFVCVRLRVAAIRTYSCNPDPLQEIRISVRYGPDKLAIRRPIHELIWRSVPVRAVKTRRRFGSKTASFHVHVCACIISLFIIVSIIYMLLVSFHVTVWYILPVWLPVSFHVMSVSAHFICSVNMSIYQYHFMCRGLPLWFKTSCSIL